jgi:hypothetical protein
MHLETCVTPHTTACVDADKTDKANSNRPIQYIRVDHNKLATFIITAKWIKHDAPQDSERLHFNAPIGAFDIVVTIGQEVT